MFYTLTQRFQFIARWAGTVKKFLNSDFMKGWVLQIFVVVICGLGGLAFLTFVIRVYIVVVRFVWNLI